MDTRSRSGTLRNEEICGDAANIYGTSTRRDSDDGAELNYLRMENLILALIHATRRLRRGDKTPKDFLIEVPLEDNKKKAEEKADTKPMKTELSCEWKLFTDGAASSDGSGA
ncbi:hypothetical protein Tco_1053987 [Tanacetum coccineum]|uniref:Reverse transcriptase RNase H-like domain-containing protein n=1 Tax=Tanacetum coccineum TaxID=301880 RepID=A0ABQ5GW48_9ASTR